MRDLECTNSTYVKVYISVNLATTSMRFFRIDKAQETLHYVTDISSEDLYVLDSEMPAGSADLQHILADVSSHKDVTLEDAECSDRSLTHNFTLPLPPSQSQNLLQFVQSDTV